MSQRLQWPLDRSSKQVMHCFRIRTAQKAYFSDAPRCMRAGDSGNARLDIELSIGSHDQSNSIR